MEMYEARRIDRWDAIRKLRTPLVAAVSGFCLGGGNELAMACDLIVASETARFGQPETGLGIIPGAGGTQRLTRAIGKAKAMDVILSGRFLDAREAERAGLVARVVAKEAWLEEAKTVARAIASKGPIAQRLAKESVNRAFESPLETGLDYERKALYLAFASEDAREGLRASRRSASPSSRAADPEPSSAHEGTAPAASRRPATAPTLKLGPFGSTGTSSRGSSGSRTTSPARARRSARRPIRRCRSSTPSTGVAADVDDQVLGPEACLRRRAVRPPPRRSRRRRRGRARGRAAEARAASRPRCRSTRARSARRA